LEIEWRNQVLLYVELGQIPKSVELEDLSRWNSMLCFKEKCENDGNAKCRDALLPFICAHAFYNIKANLLASQ
jgi:hypothetical protein